MSVFQEPAVTLALALVGVCSFIFGVIVGASVIQATDNRADRNIEKSGVWRNQDRAYRLVRSPGLDEVHK